jgi:hypothetical protein
MAQGVEHVSSKHEALSLNPNKERKKRRTQERNQIRTF